MTQAKKIFQPATSNDVCLTYAFLLDKGVVSFPLPLGSAGVIDTIVQNILSDSFGVSHYATIEERAVAYLYFLIKDHPFTDGNKRTAALVFTVLCDINDIEPDFSEFTLDELAVYIEQEKEEDHQLFIAVIAEVLFGKLTPC